MVKEEKAAKNNKESEKNGDGNDEEQAADEGASEEPESVKTGVMHNAKKIAAGDGDGARRRLDHSFAGCTFR